MVRVVQGKLSSVWREDVFVAPLDGGVWRKNKVSKNIKDIAIGDFIINVPINGELRETIIVWVDDVAIAQLNGVDTPVALTKDTRLNTKPYQVYAKSKSACLICNENGAIDYEKSVSHIVIK